MNFTNINVIDKKILIIFNRIDKLELEKHQILNNQKQKNKKRLKKKLEIMLKEDFNKKELKKKRKLVMMI